MVVVALALVAGLLVAGLVVPFNKLVFLRQLVKNAWSDVDVYLKRRAELIPNLATAVKAYATHENETLSRIARACADAMGIGDVAKRAVAEGEVARSTVAALAIAEKYPDLKASRNFLDLQDELKETERLIASARQYYNACVRDYNTTIESFPSTLVAGMARFKPAEFFSTETQAERDAPSIADKAEGLDIQATSAEPQAESHTNQKVY